MADDQISSREEAATTRRTFLDGPIRLLSQIVVILVGVCVTVIFASLSWIALFKGSEAVRASGERAWVVLVGENWHVALLGFALVLYGPAVKFLGNVAQIGSVKTLDALKIERDGNPPQSKER